MVISQAQTSSLSESSSDKKLRSVSVLVLVFLWAVIYASSMFTPALLDDADTVHAEAAREMVLNDDWVTLHANGIRYLEKAPLIYWSVAASYRAFGVKDWSTRLPLMLGVLALLLATYLLGTEAYGERAGFCAGVVMSTSLGPYLFTRFLIPDVLVGLWLALSFYFFLKSLNERPASKMDMLGSGGSLRLKRPDQGIDRAGFSGRGHRAVFAVHAKPAPFAETKAVLQHHGFVGSGRAVAYYRRAEKP